MRNFIWLTVILLLAAACTTPDALRQDVDRGDITTYTPTPTILPSYPAPPTVWLTPSPVPNHIDVPLPDLIIQHIRFDWAADHSCGVEVYLTIRNDGDVDAGMFILQVDDQQRTIPQLAAGEEQMHVFQVENGYMLPLMIDAEDNIMEAKEGNNSGLGALPFSDAIPGFVPCPYQVTPAATPTIPVMPT